MSGPRPGRRGRASRRRVRRPGSTIAPARHRRRPATGRPARWRPNGRPPPGGRCRVRDSPVARSTMRTPAGPATATARPSGVKTACVPARSESYRRKPVAASHTHTEPGAEVRSIRPSAETSTNPGRTSLPRSRAAPRRPVAASYAANPSAPAGPTTHLSSPVKFADESPNSPCFGARQTTFPVAVSSSPKASALPRSTNVTNRPSAVTSHVCRPSVLIARELVWRPVAASMRTISSAAVRATSDLPSEDGRQRRNATAGGEPSSRDRPVLASTRTTCSPTAQAADAPVGSTAVREHRVRAAQVRGRSGQALAGAGVEAPPVAVVRRRGERLAVRRDGEDVDRVVGGGEPDEGLAGIGVERGQPAVGIAVNGLAVRGDDGRVRRGVLRPFAERAEEFPVRHVPQAEAVFRREAASSKREPSAGRERPLVPRPSFGSGNSASSAPESASITAGGAGGPPEPRPRRRQ